VADQRQYRFLRFLINKTRSFAEFIRERETSALSCQGVFDTRITEQLAFNEQLERRRNVIFESKPTAASGDQDDLGLSGDFGALGLDADTFPCPSAEPNPLANRMRRRAMASAPEPAPQSLIVASQLESEPARNTPLDKEQQQQSPKIQQRQPPQGRLASGEKPLDPVTKARFVLKEGSLRKQGVVVRSWKRRWFVLRRWDLLYYKSSESCTKGENPLGVIRISARTTIEKILPSDIPRGNVGRHSHLLVLVSDPYQHQSRTEGRSYYISCASEEEREEWSNAIKTNVLGIRQRERRQQWKRSLRYQ